MKNYRFLNDSDLIALHRCYLAAFSDYAVNMQASEKQFEQRLAHNGVRLDLSVGVFNEAGEMVGFTINGHELWQGEMTAYDSGTGVTPEYRRKGISEALFDWMLPKLKRHGIHQYLLEVITTNEPAVNLYRKLGFRQTRKLAVLRSNAPLERFESKMTIEIRETQNPDWRLFQSFWDGHPSWQHSVGSFERIVGEKVIFSAHLNDVCIGYGIVLPISGRILQLAVAKNHRRKGVGSQILAACESKVVDGERLKLNNIDYSLQGMLTFCEARGFKPILSQYEMVKTI